jgi:outer membrane protein assembly factor BamA
MISCLHVMSWLGEARIKGEGKMRLRLWVMLIALAVLAGGIGPAWAQEKKPEKKAKKKWVEVNPKANKPAAETDQNSEADQGEEGASKESKILGTPYAYTGPDTGAGVGFAIMFRDLGDKKGRDTTFTASYTSNQYLDLSVAWQEPYVGSERGRLTLDLSYQTRPALRFHRIGNDAEDREAANYFHKLYTFAPTYIYRFPPQGNSTVGLRVGLNAQYFEPGNGKFDDDEAGRWARPIKKVYPHLYKSWQFDKAWAVGPTAAIYLDTRKDRFPLGGGREEIVWPLKGGYYEFAYLRTDEAFGSTYTFQRFTLDLRQYFPLISDDTIVALRFRAVVNQGEVPFYSMVYLGSGTDLRGFNSGRFIDKNSTQFQAELRQAVFPDFELALLNGAVVAGYPSICLFWDEARVYDDYTHIFENMWENYHYNYGVGFRFVVNHNLVIRIDYARSLEQGTLSMTTGLPF